MKNHSLWHLNMKEEKLMKEVVDFFLLIFSMLEDAHTVVPPTYDSFAFCGFSYWWSTVV